MNFVVHRNSAPQHEIVRGKAMYSPHQFHVDAFSEIVREMILTGNEEVVIFGENNCLAIEFVFRLKIRNEDSNGRNESKNNVSNDEGIHVSCVRIH